jgi:flagellar motor switch protein FliN/FliY
MTATSEPLLSLQLLHAVEMQVTVELGRTMLSVRDLLSLAPGSIVELDRAAGAPVDILVNGTVFATGEVVVIDDEFGVRVTEIATGDAATSDAEAAAAGVPPQLRTGT